jgi:hypothetical protein
VPRRARAAKGPACKTEIRGCKSRRRVHFGVVVLIAARRTRNAEETERNRPAPPICPRGVHRCTTAFQAERAGALPASGTTGLRCPSGRVGFQIRPGGCESLRACQFWRLGRSSDGAWPKTTRARRETASLHHFIAGSGQFRLRSHKPDHSVQLGILLPFSECSLEARHSAWDRGHACANHAAPTISSGAWPS